MLKRERYMFEHQTGEYEGMQEPEKLFVQRVESIISQEHQKWIVIRKKENKD